jgi:hypothetical protein
MIRKLLRGLKAAQKYLKHYAAISAAEHYYQTVFTANPAPTVYELAPCHQALVILGACDFGYAGISKSKADKAALRIYWDAPIEHYKATVDWFTGVLVRGHLRHDTLFTLRTLAPNLHMVLNRVIVPGETLSAKEITYILTKEWE